MLSVLERERMLKEDAQTPLSKRVIQVLSVLERERMLKEDAHVH